MDIDSTIDQLAFGRSVPKFKSCLGLYISPDVLFLSEVRIVGGKPVVDHLLRIPINSAAARQDTPTRHVGSLNTDLLADPDKIAGLLKQAMGHVKWGSKFLMVSLSHHFGLVRFFSMPGIDRRFWKTAVTAEAKKYIPIPFEELTNGFQVGALAPGPDKRPRQGVLFGVTHNKIMQGLRSLAQKLDLTWIGLELSPCSAQRLWDTLDTSANAAPIAHLYIEGISVRILLSENGVPIFFREVQIGDEMGNLDRRRLDLTGSIEFTRKQLGAQKPSQVKVEGVTQDINGWKEVLGQETGLPVQIRDTAKNLGLKAGEWGGYASIGCALRYLTSTRVTMCIGNFGQVSDEDRRAAYGIFGLAGVLSAILLLISGISQVRAMIKSSQLGKMNQGNAVAAFQGKTADQIQKMLQDMEQKVNSMGAFAGSGRKATGFLQDMAEIVPDSVWLTSLVYTTTISNTGLSNATRRLELIGHTAGSNAMAEQDMAIQFREKLMAHPDFGKMFNCSGVSVQTSVGDARGRASGQKEDDESHTTFTLGCESKQG